jgi:integrase
MSIYAIIPSAAEPVNTERWDLARRRFQKGTIELYNGNWTGRYLEDVVDAGGKITRVHRRVFLGTKTDLPTEKLARRKFEPIMAEVNNSTKPKTVITLNDFLVRWEPLGMPKTETAKNFKYALAKYLKPAFGDCQLTQIGTEQIQRFVSQTQTSAANMHNILKCFRAVWKAGKAWGYVSHNPFQDLILPSIQKQERPYFNEAQLCQILNAAPEPYKTLYWVLAQTGLRIGEILALTWKTLDLDKAAVYVVSSVAQGRIREQVTKTETAKRVIPLSPVLTNHLFTFRTNWTPNPHNLVFAHKGQPWKADTLLKCHLQPLLVKLGIPSAGFHAFRHASATILSRMRVPTEIKRARMGHTEDEMTLRYTHVIEEDARKVAAGFDQFLLPEAVGV